MRRQRLVFLACCGVALAALMLGLVLVALYGLSLPPWLMTAGLAVCFGLALLCGFTAVLPSLVPILRLPEVQGALFVIAAMAAIWLPQQFLFAGVFLALGVRRVWLRACELAEAEQGPDVVGCELVRANGDATPATVERGNGSVVRR